MGFSLNYSVNQSTTDSVRLPHCTCKIVNAPLTLLYDLFFSFSIKTLEEIKEHWNRFGSAFETFSLWISDKEKHLDVVKSSALPLEQQINIIKVVVYCSIMLMQLKKTAANI